MKLGKEQSTSKAYLDRLVLDFSVRILMLCCALRFGGHHRLEIVMQCQGQVRRVLLYPSQELAVGAIKATDIAVGIGYREAGCLRITDQYLGIVVDYLEESLSGLIIDSHDAIPYRVIENVSTRASQFVPRSISFPCPGCHPSLAPVF